MHSYEIISAGVDHTGWYKVWLRRDDGKEIKTTRKRCAELKRQGRLFLADDVTGDCRYFPAWNER